MQAKGDIGQVSQGLMGFDKRRVKVGNTSCIRGLVLKCVLCRDKLMRLAVVGGRNLTCK